MSEAFAIFSIFSLYSVGFFFWILPSDTLEYSAVCYYECLHWCLMPPECVPFLKYILSESCGQKISRAKTHLKRSPWHLSLSCINLLFVLDFFAMVFYYALNKRKPFPFIFDSTPSEQHFPLWSLVLCCVSSISCLPGWSSDRQLEDLGLFQHKLEALQSHKISQDFCLVMGFYFSFGWNKSGWAIKHRECCAAHGHSAGSCVLGWDVSEASAQGACVVLC